MKEEQDPAMRREIERMIAERLAAFNVGRRSEGGRYYILPPTGRTPYYTLWYYNPEATYHTFIYLLDLELNAIGSVNRAIREVQNSFLPLGFIREIDAPYGNGDDILQFGKYRGYHLQEVYRADPRYILWIADRYEPHTRGEHRMKELASGYAKAYLDLQTARRYKPLSSRFVGQEGETLRDLTLTLLRVRVEDDPYRTKAVGGSVYYYVDQKLVAVDGAGNLYLIAIKARERSLVSGRLPAGVRAYQMGERLRLASARVQKHLMWHNVCYTKLGYVRLV